MLLNQIYFVYFLKILLIFELVILITASDVDSIFLISTPKNTTTITNNNVKKRFEPNWDSLDGRPLPSWYDKSKIGIFIHWGVYSVPAYGTEWFWTNWRTVKVPGYIDFMARNYKPGFMYQEFANEFTAELFNATEWVEIFQQSGAKYIVLTSKHHDGYALWPSKYSFSWNSMDVGPHRDIVGDLANAIRNDKISKSLQLHYGLYHSLFEWYNPMYEADRDKQFLENEFVLKKVLPEMKELVEKYKPEVIWSDGDWETDYQYWQSTEFLAWLYNDSPVSDSVVTNDRWGSGTLCKHGDFFTCSDRYNPGVLQPKKWENAMTLDRYSWGHRDNAKLSDYITSKELIRELVVTVSCGGNILINVGPTKTGIIEPIFVERLQDMGNWLKVNGEAIYNTIPWKYQNDTNKNDIWYTAAAENDINYMSESQFTIYGIILEYPYDDFGVKLYTIYDYFSDNSFVSILGYTNHLKWTRFTDHIFISFPKKEELDKIGLQFAWTLKIDIL